MRILIALLLLTFALPSYAAQAQARSEGIAAVVNQDAISMTDLNDRIFMVMASSGLPRTEEIRDKLTGQVLNDLVNEQLKVQEAKRNNLEVTDSEIQNGLVTLAKQNNLTPEQFAQVMQHQGISRATVERQIRAEIGWSKVIQQVMRPKVNVTDSDIDEYIAQLQNAKGKSEYLLAEIFLPVNAESPEGDTQQLANRLVQELKTSKVPFSKVAQQFSAGPGAQKGGDLGWMQQGQFQPELEKVVAGMEKGTISNPVRTTEGYHILLLRDVRTLTDETFPSRDKILNTIGLQRLERLQARELLELRTTAFIENRVQS